MYHVRSEFHIAVRDNHPSKVKQLIQQGAHVNSYDCNFEGDTALTIACRAGHLELVKVLIEIGHANVDTQNIAGWMPLYLATLYGHLNVVRLLIEVGCANVNRTSCNKETALIGACYKGYLGIVQLLLETDGTNINAPNSAGETPLQQACRFGHTEIAKLLIGTGRVNTNAIDLDGRTPLYWAAGEGYVECVKLLLDTGVGNVDVQTRLDRKKPLDVAVDNRNTGSDIVNVVIESGRVSLVAASEKGWTPLHIASWKGRWEIVKLLIATGRINLDARNNKGKTALHLACDGETSLCLTYDHRACRGETALREHLACEDRYCRVITLLVETGGANVDAQDESGQTPLHNAVCENSVGVVKHLRETCHASIDIPAKNGDTALQIAIKGWTATSGWKEMWTVIVLLKSFPYN